MKKILKSKKLIAFLLAFTISFTTYSNIKQEKVQAIAVIDDVTLYLILGTIILATGINATSKNQVSHMGSIVWDKFTSLGGTIEDIATETYQGVKGLKIGEKLKQALKESFASVPKTDLDVYKDIPFTSGQTLSIPYIPTSESGRYTLYTFHAIGDVRYNNRSANVSGGVTGRDFRIIVYPKYLYFNYVVGDGGADETITGNSFTLTGNITNLKINEKIKYSDSVIWQNADVSKLDVTMPYTDTNTGFIPLPSDTSTIYDNLTHDTPLTWDKVQDLVVDFPVDTTVDDDIVVPPPTIDGDITGDETIPGEGVIDGVGDSILNPTFDKTLDFSPLYLDLSKKFPFCIPWDMYNLVKEFSFTKEKPILYFTFPEKIFNSYRLEIDLAFYDSYFPFTSILRYILLIGFVYALIKNTRNMISN